MVMSMERKGTKYRCMSGNSSRIARRNYSGNGGLRYVLIYFLETGFEDGHVFMLVLLSFTFRGLVS
jgi:hypothetical protein